MECNATRSHKLLLIKQSGKYIGHVISNDSRQTDLDKIAPISNLVLKKQVMSLLGILNYCHAWIPDYAEIFQPLSDLAHKHPIQMNDFTWSGEAETAFECFKSTVANVACLSNPNYAKPFRLYIHEKNDFMSGILTQSHGKK